MKNTQKQVLILVEIWIIFNVSTKTFTAMPNFVVNTSVSNGNHYVHDENSMCKYLPSPEDRRNLGWFSSSQGAIDEAKKSFGTANGCRHCAKMVNERGLEYLELAHILGSINTCMIHLSNSFLSSGNFLKKSLACSLVLK